MLSRLYAEPWMRWYDLPWLRRVGLSWWAARRKNWHPHRRRLARLRALYWFLIRGHETEICCRHGGPVSVVFHVPDELWIRHSGFPNAPSGVLCVPCFDDLHSESGTGYLEWTCEVADRGPVGGERG